MEAADIPDSLWWSSSIGVLRPPKIAESDFLVAFWSTEGSREHGSMVVISSVKVKYDKTLGYFTDTRSAKRNDAIMKGSEWVKNGKTKWGDQNVGMRREISR